jgi:hypothetical protein
MECGGLGSHQEGSDGRAVALDEAGAVVKARGEQILCVLQRRKQQRPVIQGLGEMKGG